MPECNPKDCPVSARVDALKDEFDRYRDSSSKTHQAMFNRIGALEQDKTALATRLEGMDAKLDKLVSWREVQDDKPNKLLDKLKESSIWLVLAAVIGVVLGRLGL